MNKFYVYAYIDPNTGKPFYIDQGTRKKLTEIPRDPFAKDYINYLLSIGYNSVLNTKMLHICGSKAEALVVKAKEVKNALLKGHLLLNKTNSITKVQQEVILAALRNVGKLPDSNEALSDFIKRKRKESNLSVQELAEKARVTQNVIKDIENSKKTLRLDKVNQVLAVFESQLVPYQK